MNSSSVEALACPCGLELINLTLMDKALDGIGIVKKNKTTTTTNKKKKTDFPRIQDKHFSKMKNSVIVIETVVVGGRDRGGGVGVGGVGVRHQGAVR